MSLVVAPGAGEELLDLVQQRVAVAEEREVVASLERDEACALDRLGYLPPLLEADHWVLAPVKHERRTRIAGRTARMSTWLSISTSWRTIPGEAAAARAAEPLQRRRIVGDARSEDVDRPASPHAFSMRSVSSSASGGVRT